MSQQMQAVIAQGQNLHILKTKQIRTVFNNNCLFGHLSHVVKAVPELLQESVLTFLGVFQTIILNELVINRK